MGKLFIINTITFWHEPPRARHQLAYALARHFPVIFISANKIGFPKYEILKENSNLSFYIPYFPISYKIRIRIPIINLIYQKWLFRKLKKNYPDSIVINFDFTAKYISQYFNSYIYYCNDDHIGMSNKNNYKWIAKYQESCEKIVAQNSLYCVGTSKFLADKLKKNNPNSYEIRLGAPHIDNVHNYINKAKSKNYKINVGLVGYIGTVDFLLLEELIKNEDMSFTFVGPIDEKSKRKLDSLQNIKTTGSLLGNQLYEEVSKFDVGLIPYNLNSIIDRTPNKLWLYLALGKPVVISNIEGIKDWKFPEKFIYRSNSSHEFVNLIRKAYKENSEQLLKERISFAQLNSWEKRTEDFLEIYKDLLKTEV